jgi:hypothetical protein
MLKDSHQLLEETTQGMDPSESSDLSFATLTRPLNAFGTYPDGFFPKSTTKAEACLK